MSSGWRQGSTLPPRSAENGGRPPVIADTKRGEFLRDLQDSEEGRA